MTTQQCYESIKQLFPELGAAQIIWEMNSAQNRFARETGILRKIGNLQTLTSKVAWALASDCIEIYEVELYDSNGKELNKVDESIDWFIDDGYIIFYDTSSTRKITTIPTTINAIWVRYKHLPTALTVDKDERADNVLEVGAQFAEGVLAGALENSYAKYRQPLGIDREGNTILGIDYKSRDYWRSKFHEIKLDAKRYANSLDSTEGRVRNYEHAGLYSIPKEAKNATVSATNWA